MKANPEVCQSSKKEGVTSSRKVSQSQNFCQADRFDRRDKTQGSGPWQIPEVLHSNDFVPPIFASSLHLTGAFSQRETCKPSNIETRKPEGKHYETLKQSLLFKPEGNNLSGFFWTLKHSASVILKEALRPEARLAPCAAGLPHEGTPECFGGRGTEREAAKHARDLKQTNVQHTQGTILIILYRCCRCTRDMKVT